MNAYPGNAPVGPQTHFCTLSFFLSDDSQVIPGFNIVSTTQFCTGNAVGWEPQKRQKQSSASQGLEGLVGLVRKRLTAGCRKSTGICPTGRNWVWGTRDRSYSSHRGVQISFSSPKPCPFWDNTLSPHFFVIQLTACSCCWDTFVLPPAAPGNWLQLLAGLDSPAQLTCLDTWQSPCAL